AGQPGDEASDSSGYAVMDGSKLSVLGNEVAARQSSSNPRDSNRAGHGAGPGDASSAAIARSEVLHGLNPVNRQSGVVSSEATIEEYQDLVDHYFKSITTRSLEEKHE